jgi:hypothetical protein
MTEATAADLARLAARSFKISEPLNRQIRIEGGDGSNFSYANTLLCLCAEVLCAFRWLVEAHSERQVQHCAWISRNLLERSIWCEYSV